MSVLQFLKPINSNAERINTASVRLYRLLSELNPTDLPISEHYKQYFIQHHLGARLHFSIRNSAHIIFESVEKSGKPIEQLRVVDYGAGLGTLYLLAGMLNFKTVVYNDYLPDWKATAVAVADALNIKVDAYVTGDIDAVTAYADEQDWVLDIIASRNVAEHIYSLTFFFTHLHQHNPNAIIYSTTSANYHNPAMWLKHILLHKKTEKQHYRLERSKAIKAYWPQINEQQLNRLIEITRGRAKKDFYAAIDDFRAGKSIAPVPFLGTNTCAYQTGYWCEHLISKSAYTSIINSAGFKCSYTAGYWDTHYNNAVMNLLGRFLNILLPLLGKRGILIAPFVNIIAY